MHISEVYREHDACGADDCISGHRLHPSSSSLAVFVSATNADIWEQNTRSDTVDSKTFHSPYTHLELIYFFFLV